jgi:uncharacterized protein YciI
MPMKHFLLEGEHLVPFAEMAHLVKEHHAFLDKGYRDGVFLFSGPHVPPKGGFLVTRAENLETLNAYLADEPFVKAKVMRFSRVTEFDPVQHQGFLKEWFKGSQAAHLEYGKP